MTVRIEPNRNWKRLTLSAPARETRTTPAAMPGVEDERERLVAGCAAAGAQPLDRQRADHGCDERRQHRRDAEQVAERDAGERDVPEAVADQRGLPLDEEEADGRREQPDDRARREREAHELEVKHVMAVVVLMGRVVPHAGEPARRAVVDDPAADEHDPVDDVLDRAELVRDVEDRDAEVRAQRLEQEPERLLRGGVDTRRRLVEREQRRLGGERLRDQRPLLHPARERAQRCVGPVREPDGLDRTRDGLAVGAAQRPPDARGSEPAGRDDLAHRHRAPRRGAASAAAGSRCGRRRAPLPAGLAEDAHACPRSAARARARAAAASSCRRRSAPRSHELARCDGERDVLEHPDARPVAERDVVELDDGIAHGSCIPAPSAAWRGSSRMTEK